MGRRSNFLPTFRTEGSDEDNACTYCGKAHSVYNPCKTMQAIDRAHAGSGLDPVEYYHPSYSDRLKDGFALLGQD